MEKEQFLSLLENYQTELDLHNKDEILSYKEKYPYCALFHLMDLLSNRSSDKNTWQNLLSKTAIYVSDREFLKKRIFISDATHASSSIQLRSRNNEIEGAPLEKGKIHAAKDPEPLKQEPSIDILSEIDAYEEITFKTASKKELIEKFLEIQSPKIQKPTSIIQENTLEQEQKNVDKTTEEPLTFASETLALLYEKQGNINKALKIYEVLNLKYPEKSATFANQIERLKKLLK